MLILVVAIYFNGQSYLPNRHFWNNRLFVTHAPTFSCGFERKVGSRGDGGKRTCDPHRLARGGCLEYSIRSNNQLNFEKEMHARYQSEAHIFDPTVSKSKALKHVTSFHKLGITDSNHTDNKVFLTIGRITKMLHHANCTIDIFKNGCEGTCIYMHYVYTSHYLFIKK